jgi:hypothetical protein
MNTHPAIVFLIVFTIPTVYLFVEEREGRQLNPKGPSLKKRLELSLRKKSGYLYGAILAGVIVGLTRDDWPRGISLAAFTLAAPVMLAIHDAVRALKDDHPDNH